MKTQKLSTKDLNRFLKVGLQASEQAAKKSLFYFSKKLKVEEKPDRTLVTEADRATEAVTRRVIRRNFPEHSIAGEEFEDENKKNSDFRWWIDPIDGTLSFIRGQRIWGSVIGLEFRGEVVMGVIDHPALNLRIHAAKGQGCLANGEKTKCSSVRNLKHSSIYFGGIKRLAGFQKSSLHSLIDKAQDHRGWGDTFGHSAVILGHAEAMIDFKVHAYDVSAIKICVEEAGGKFTSLLGKKSIHEGSAVSTNGKIHSQILRHFKN